MSENDQLYQFDDQKNKAFKFEELISDPGTRATVRAMVVEAITEGIRAHCRIPISGNEAQQVRFIFDELRRLGDGDVHAGIDQAFANHQHVKESRNRFARLSEKVGAAVLLFVVMGLVAACWKGIKFFGAQP